MASGGYFHRMFTYSCYFEYAYVYFGCSKPLIWQALCLHLGTLGTILAGWGHPGGLCEQQEGDQIFSDLGFIFRACWVQMGYISFFCRLVSRSFFDRCSNRNPDSWRSPNKVSIKELLHKICVSHNFVFLWFMESIFAFFSEALRAVFLAFTAP